MKKLGKLSINPEKLMKNEELVNLKGGYGQSGSYWICDCDGVEKKFYVSDCEAAKRAAKNFCTNYTCC
ncbi:MAG: hypothetical protein AB2L20_22335 [Mangrovibacterium sp.]